MRKHYLLFGLLLLSPLALAFSPSSQNMEQVKEQFAQMLKSQLIPALEQLKQQYSQYPQMVNGIDTVIQKINKLEPLNQKDLEVFKEIARIEVENKSVEELKKELPQLITQLEGAKNMLTQMAMMYGIQNSPVIQDIVKRLDSIINTLQKERENPSKEVVLQALTETYLFPFQLLNMLLYSFSSAQTTVNSTEIYAKNETSNITNSTAPGNITVNQPREVNARKQEKSINPNTSLNITEQQPNVSSSIAIPQNVSSQKEKIVKAENKSVASNKLSNKLVNQSSSAPTHRQSVTKHPTSPVSGKTSKEQNLPNPEQKIQEIKTKLGQVRVKLYLLANKASLELRQKGKLDPSLKAELFNYIKEYLQLRLEELKYQFSNNPQLVGKIDSLLSQLKMVNSVYQLKEIFKEYIKLYYGI